MTPMMWKFKIGDRVCREKPDGELRHGTVIDVNQSYRDHLGEFLILYSVRWDDTGTIEKGYMDVANGLIADSEKTKLDR